MKYHETYLLRDWNMSSTPICIQSSRFVDRIVNNFVQRTPAPITLLPNDDMNSSRQRQLADQFPNSLLMIQTTWKQKNKINESTSFDWN